MIKRLLGYMEMGGETVVVLAAALWMTQGVWVPYLFAAGTVLFAVGRLAQGREAILAETPQQKRLNMNRLLRQRNIGIVLLMLAAALMLVAMNTSARAMIAMIPHIRPLLIFLVPSFAFEYILVNYLSGLLIS